MKYECRKQAMMASELIGAYAQEIKILTGIITAYDYSFPVLADITLYRERLNTLNEELKKLKERINENIKEIIIKLNDNTNIKWMYKSHSS